ncbi:MAG: S41 family peptidase [Saprospiraceae bacterium]
MKNRIIFILCIVFTLQSCLKDDLKNTNQDIFQYIWDDMDQNYGGFSPRNIDWNSLYEIYYPQAVASETEAELFSICTEMLDNLDDQHIFVYSNNLDQGFSSGKEDDEILAEAEFDASIITNNYLDNFKTIDADDESLIYGFIENENFGYIYIPNFGFNGVRWFEEIDHIISVLEDTEGLIIDVRNNGGGSPIIDRYISSRFVSEEKFVFTIQTRNGPQHSEFDEPIAYFATPKGDKQYTKNTIILTNHSTVSAGEEFILFLETQPHITVVGDTTSNAFSTTTFDRLLPNGWEYGFPNQLYLYPDGTSPEGVGIIPDFYIRNDSLDVQNGIDKALEKAIDML